MRISIEEGEQYAETEILIRCRKTDPELVKLISLLQVFDRKLTGIREGQTFLLEAADILYIDTADKKTFLYTAGEVYETPLRLYELGNGWRPAISSVRPNPLLSISTAFVPCARISAAECLPPW